METTARGTLRCWAQNTPGLCWESERCYEDPLAKTPPLGPPLARDLLRKRSRVRHQGLGYPTTAPVCWATTGHILLGRLPGEELAVCPGICHTGSGHLHVGGEVGQSEGQGVL